VREREPLRTVVLGSNNFNSPAAYEHLDIPQDQHLILTFHYYSPMPVTHYKAPWWRAGGEYDGPIQYPGVTIPPEACERLDERLKKALVGYTRLHDRQVMLEQISRPLQARQRTGLPLYCGEFGCRSETPWPLREAWYRDLVSLLTEQQIAWANWDYRGGFGIVDRERRSTGVAEVMLAASGG
jgi:endoglucanase